MSLVREQANLSGVFTFDNIKLQNLKVLNKLAGKDYAHTAGIMAANGWGGYGVKFYNIIIKNIILVLFCT